MLKPTQAVSLARSVSSPWWPTKPEPLGLEDVGEHGVLMDVGHENAVAIFPRKFVGEVDARAAVRRAVAVVGDGLDVVVNVGVDVLAALPVIDAAGNHMPQMRDHAGGDEELAVIVEIEAPGIAEAMRDDLEAILRWVVAQDATVDVLAVFHGDLIGEGVALA